MSVWVVLAQGLLATGALAAVAWPWLSRKELKGLAPSGGDALRIERETLLVEKRVAYDAIKELELDWKSGKLSEGDYKSIRAELEAEAIGVLKQLDSMESPEEDVQEIKKTHCPSCGEKSEEDHSFCHACGARLG